MQKKLLVVLLAACSSDPKPQLTPDAPDMVQPDAPAPPVNNCDQTPSDLRTDLAWDGNNRATLTTWLDAAGCKSPTYDKAHKPIALWDWDNTISKNDFGDGITYWFIANGKVLQPPN